MAAVALIGARVQITYKHSAEPSTVAFCSLQQYRVVLSNSRAAPRAFMQHRWRRWVSINTINAFGLVRRQWQQGISVLSRTTPSLEMPSIHKVHYNTAREKKTSAIPVPSRPASSHLVGFQKGYGVALAQCGLQLYSMPTEVAICYRTTGQAHVPLYRGLAGVEGRLVPGMLPSSLICRFRWKSVQSDDGASAGR